MPWSTTFATKRITDSILRGENVLKNQAGDVLQDYADEAAQNWSQKIARSGRAPGHGMENVSASVTAPKSGGYFVRMGWLNNPPKAADGKTTWFVYQDVGYDLFGRGSTFIPGLFLQIDARADLQAKLGEAREVIAQMVKREIRSKRA